jgi:prepilin-type N-terminal cleavage/methylation domain-containing protein/prepilin-type processing-associated H-X9-DG protein
MAAADKRVGFTLVEMLVVVAIIGTLVGLLLPAINMAREAARRTQCINNQQEIGKAILRYESSKQRLPGVVNCVNPNDARDLFRTNWVMALFGDLGRDDLLEYWRNGVDITKYPGPLQVVKVDLLVCPSNKSNDVPGGLAYVVNMGVYSGDSNNPVYTGRIFRNRASFNGTNFSPEPDFNFINLKTASRTVLLSESLNAGPWNYLPLPPPALGMAPNIFRYPNRPEADLGRLAFQWTNSSWVPLAPHPMPTITTPVSTIYPYVPALSSNHSGKIVVTFCDGHTEAIPDITTCWNDADNPLYGTP